jgi:D-erythronate 2-dehydrogenase
VAENLRVLVTGAGHALIQRLQTGAMLGSRTIGRLTVLDTKLPVGDPDAGIVRHVRGSIADRTVIDEAWGDGIDVVYHLASVPGGAA